MKKVFLSLILCACAFGASAQQSFQDTARVLRSEPIVAQVYVPCQQQGQAQYPGQNGGNPFSVYQNAGYASNEGRSNTGAVIGGVAGGLLGSTVGGGNGKVAAAAVGAIVGAISGDRLDNRSSNQGQVVQAACQGSTVTQVTGYLVTFEYQGRQGQKRVQYEPGSSISVTVSIN